MRYNNCTPARRRLDRKTRPIILHNFVQKKHKKIKIVWRTCTSPFKIVVDRGEFTGIVDCPRVFRSTGVGAIIVEQLCSVLKWHKWAGRARSMAGHLSTVGVIKRLAHCLSNCLSAI